MNKLTKLQMEIDKIKQKISEQQTRLRELEQQKTEIENTEIVELVRSMKMNTSELSTFLDCQHLLGQLFLGQNCLVFNRTKIS